MDQGQSRKGKLKCLPSISWAELLGFGIRAYTFSGWTGCWSLGHISSGAESEDEHDKPSSSTLLSESERPESDDEHDKPSSSTLLSESERPSSSQEINLGHSSG